MISQEMPFKIWQLRLLIWIYWCIVKNHCNYDTALVTTALKANRTIVALPIIVLGVIIFTFLWEK